tara:strand:+ start:602 stop:1360 length:759 start_codon:yes stop_codon:yes gene_type:complete
MKIILVYIFLFPSLILARELGQTEITAEEGMEVYQNEKYYLLKKNVEIDSDNFILTAQQVKAYFNKDLYDITKIYSKGNVVFESENGLKVLGNEINHNIIDEIIKVTGKNSFLQNNEFTMISDGLININNIAGEFKLNGSNSKLTTKEIIITGDDIRGKYINIDGENVVEKLFVDDETQININTETSNMFAKKAIYNKQENIIELFENVIIIRNNENITGDYAKMNTLNESFFVKTNKKSKRVKALLENTDE